MQVRRNETRFVRSKRLEGRVALISRGLLQEPPGDVIATVISCAAPSFRPPAGYYEDESDINRNYFRTRREVNGKGRGF